MRKGALADLTSLAATLTSGGPQRAPLAVSGSFLREPVPPLETLPNASEERISGICSRRALRQPLQNRSAEPISVNRASVSGLRKPTPPPCTHATSGGKHVPRNCCCCCCCCCCFYAPAAIAAAAAARAATALQNAPGDWRIARRELRELRELREASENCGNSAPHIPKLR